MTRLRLAHGAVAVCLAAGAPRPASAQATSADSVFLRAQQLVDAGQGAAGRVAVDSMLGATPSTSPAYPTVLFWRASLAASAADAERDYLRIAVEYPLSPRSSDALIRLAQLELARGDRGEAMRHLERLQLEHPTGPARPRGAYWIARVFLDGGDIPRACTSLRTARDQAGADAALRTQIDYYGRQCASSGVARGGAGPAAAPPTAGATANAGKVAGAASPAARMEYSAQCAAYGTTAPAEALAKKLRGRGWSARVDDAAGKYRVRIGRYATFAEAATTARRLRQVGIDAFVVETEIRE